MYQWRKFEFFEEKLAGRCTIPEEVREKKIECCSSGRGKVVIGCNDGSVNLLDRGLKFSYGFQAHSSTVSFLQQLKVGSCLFCFVAKKPWEALGFPLLNRSRVFFFLSLEEFGFFSASACL